MAVAAEAFMAQRARAVEASVPLRRNGKETASPLSLRTFIVDDGRGNRHAIRGRPHEVFEEVFEAYADRIFAYALRRTENVQDAEDVGQEAFLRAYRNSLEYPEDQRTIYTGPWLYEIVRNVCTDVERQRRLFKSLPMDPSHEEGIETKSRYEKPQAVAEMHQEQEFVHRVLDKLEPYQRTILVLREFQGLSCAQIAEVVGSTSSAVKSCLHRAREEFRKVARKLDPSCSAV